MSHGLPDPIARWTTSIIGRSPSEETHATCASCALCPGGGDGRRPKGRITYRPDVKCCTDRPVLPNYLIGATLSEGSPDGQRTLRERLQTDQVTPLGVGGTPGAPAPASARQSGCPHLVDGGCSIHAHRNAGCSTWFCKHERGVLGQRAWFALQSVLRAAESRLALWCALESGLPETSLQYLVALGETVPGMSSDASVPVEVLWAGVDDREAWFIEAWSRVSDLDWDDVIAIAGPELAVLERIARAAWSALDQPLPERMRPGVYQVVATGSDGVLAETYTPRDPIGLPRALLGVLHHFDGRPTAEVLDRLAREEGVALEADFLRQLVDFQVLSEAQ